MASSWRDDAKKHWISRYFLQCNIEHARKKEKNGQGMDRRNFMLAAMRAGAGVFASGAFGKTVSANTTAKTVPPLPASESISPVGLRLALVIDVSGSENDAEFTVIKESIAETVRSRDFQDAVFLPGGPGSIALCAILFSDRSELALPWVDLRRRDDALFGRVADAIKAIPRTMSGGTGQAQALQFAAHCFDQCPWSARRSVADVITDGEENDASPDEVPKVVRQLAANGVTVNALITAVPEYSGKGGYTTGNDEGDDQDLESWARKYLVTPPGFHNKNGRPLDPGFAKTVASRGTAGQGNDTVVNFRDNMRLALRDSVMVEIARLDPTPLSPAMNRALPTVS